MSLGAAALRVPTRSLTPSSWDPANFVLAMDRIDLETHQPHPPAAIGYVLAGRLLAPLLGDANLALVAVNLLFTAAMGPLLFAFAFHASSQRRARHGWIALAALLASPLLWFYGCVGEIYVAETCLGLTVAYACLRVLQGRESYAVLAGAGLAVLGAFRVTGMAFLLPLFATTLLLHRRSGRAASRGFGAFLLVSAAWAVPFLAWAGPGTYFRVLFDHFARTTQPTSVFAGGTARILNHHLRDALYALLAGVGLFNALALPAFLGLRRGWWLPGRGLVFFAALWTLPGLLFYVLVHMAKPGYLLPAVPAACLGLAFVYGQEPRRPLLWALVGGQLLGGAWQFLVAQPAVGGAVGAGIRYSEKTWSQKARVELGSVLQPSRAAIVQADRELQQLEQELETACPGAAGVVLVARDGPGPNWRRLMAAFPAAQSVRLPATRGDPWMLARGRRLGVIGSGELALDEICRSYWVSPPPTVLDALRARAPVQQAETGALPLYWTRGPVRLSLEGGQQITIRGGS